MMTGLCALLILATAISHASTKPVLHRSSPKADIHHLDKNTRTADAGYLEDGRDTEYSLYSRINGDFGRRVSSVKYNQDIHSKHIEGKEKGSENEMRRRLHKKLKDNVSTTSNQLKVKNDLIVAEPVATHQSHAGRIAIIKRTRKAPLTTFQQEDISHKTRLKYNDKNEDYAATATGGYHEARASVFANTHKRKYGSIFNLGWNFTAIRDNQTPGADIVTEVSVVTEVSEVIERSWKKKRDIVIRGDRMGEDDSVTDGTRTNERDGIRFVAGGIQEAGKTEAGTINANAPQTISNEVVTTEAAAIKVVAKKGGANNSSANLSGVVKDNATEYREIVTSTAEATESGANETGAIETAATVVVRNKAVATKPGSTKVGANESSATEINVVTDDVGRVIETADGSAANIGATEADRKENGASEANATEDCAIDTRETEVGTTKVGKGEGGEPKARATEAGLTENGSMEGGSMEVGSNGVSAIEVNATDASPTKHSATKVTATQTCTTDTGATDVGATDVGATEAGTNKTSVTEADTSKAEDTKACVTETGATEIAVNEYGEIKAGATNDGTTEVGTTEAGTTIVDTTEADTTDAGTTKAGATETAARKGGATEDNNNITGVNKTYSSKVGAKEAGAIEVSPNKTGTINVGATEAGTTETVTTETVTTEAVTTETVTTEAVTTEAVTTEAGTTKSGTTEAGTTEVSSIAASTTAADTTEVDTTEIGTTDAGTIEAGINKAGTTLSGTTTVGTTEAGTTEAGTTEAGTTEAGTTEAGTSEAGTTKAGTTGVGTTEIGTTDAGTTEAGTNKAGKTLAGMTTAGTTEAGTTEAGTTEAGTIAASTTAADTTEAGTTDLGTTKSVTTVDDTTEAGTADTGATIDCAADAGVTETCTTDAGTTVARMTDASTTKAGATKGGVAKDGVIEAGATTEIGSANAGTSKTGFTAAGATNAVAIVTSLIGSNTTEAGSFESFSRAVTATKHGRTDTSATEPSITDNGLSKAFASKFASTEPVMTEDGASKAGASETVVSNATSTEDGTTEAELYEVHTIKVGLPKTGEVEPGKTEAGETVADLTKAGDVKAIVTEAGENNVAGVFHVTRGILDQSWNNKRYGVKGGVVTGRNELSDKGITRGKGISEIEFTKESKLPIRFESTDVVGVTDVANLSDIVGVTGSTKVMGTLVTEIRLPSKSHEVANKNYNANKPFMVRKPEGGKIIKVTSASVVSNDFIKEISRENNNGTEQGLVEGKLVRDEEKLSRGKFFLAKGKFSDGVMLPSKYVDDTQDAAGENGGRVVSTEGTVRIISPEISRENNNGTKQGLVEGKLVRDEEKLSRGKKFLAKGKFSDGVKLPLKYVKYIKSMGYAAGAGENGGRIVSTKGTVRIISPEEDVASKYSDVSVESISKLNKVVGHIENSKEANSNGSTHGNNGHTENKLFVEDEVKIEEVTDGTIYQTYKGSTNEISGVNNNLGGETINDDNNDRHYKDHSQFINAYNLGGNDADSSYVVQKNIGGYLVNEDISDSMLFSGLSLQPSGDGYRDELYSQDTGYSVSSEGATSAYHGQGGSVYAGLDSHSIFDQNHRSNGELAIFYRKINDPAKYHFGYEVNDERSRDIKSHEEERNGDLTRGSYSLREPDGTIRTVDYHVDGLGGFQALVKKNGYTLHIPPRRVLRSKY